MPKALELITGRATAPGAVATALTMSTGNSATVRFSPEAAKTWLICVWADVQGAGTLRIRSPKLHDATQGIRLDTTASDASPLWPFGVVQRLYSQDTLTIDITGSAVAGDIENVGMLIYYEDQPGINARLGKWSDIKDKIVNVETVENTISTGAAGDYSGEEAINAEFDLLKANTDYALLGYMVDTEAGAVRWRGPDTGNTGVGGPGNETLRHVTAEWFKRLSQSLDLPLIPIINSANKAATLVDCLQDENGADPTVTTFLAELAGGGGAAR